jgi:Rap1 Myb domain.
MGAFNIPTKSRRAYFTLKEDQILFDWVEHFGQEPGAPIQGNRIYQDLSELVCSPVSVKATERTHQYDTNW